MSALQVEAEKGDQITRTLQYKAGSITAAAIPFPEALQLLSHVKWSKLRPLDRAMIAKVILGVVLR